MKQIHWFIKMEVAHIRPCDFISQGVAKRIADIIRIRTESLASEDKILDAYQDYIKRWDNGIVSRPKQTRGWTEDMIRRLQECHDNFNNGESNRCMHVHPHENTPTTLAC